jgi:hypothetical protein
LYGFVENDGVDQWDILGNQTCCPNSQVPFGYNEIYLSVSAAIGLAGKGGLPENPQEWGALFVVSASGYKVFQIQSACLACHGDVMKRYCSDDKVLDRALGVCDKICELAAKLAAAAANSILDLPGPSLR